MKTFKKFLALFLVLIFSLNAFSQDDSGIPDDDRGLFSNDESTQEKEKDKKRVWDRWFEIGVMADVGISNNYFHISDLLKEEIIINMDEINNGLEKNGLGINNSLGTNAFINLNTNIFKASLSVGVEEKLNFTLGKGLFDFLANGNELDEAIVVSAGIGASVFEENSFSLEIPVGKLKIKATPSYFVPLLYVPYTPAEINAKIGSDGKVTANGTATAIVYSPLPLNNFDEFSYDSIFNAFSHGGFDISLSGEYQLFESFSVGATLTHIPIVPSNLSCTNKYTASVNFEMDGLLDSLTKKAETEEESELFKYDYSLSENESAEQNPCKLVRPFKIGFNANWKVFNNNLLILSPMIQFKFADFTLENLLGFGFDYEITAKSYLGPLEPSFTTSCIDSVFSQQFNLALNLRLVEIDFLISTQSKNFLKSFAGSGLGVGVGFKVGF